MTLPNFFIVGAPKAGTTSLYQYLTQHPQVYMSPLKEPTFFGRDDLLSGVWREVTLRQVEREREALRAYLAGPMDERRWLLTLEQDDYERLFSAVRSEIAIGEASVSYFWLPRAATAMRAGVPQARLIFVLRNPVEMVFSQYLAGLAHWHSPTFRSWFLEEGKLDRIHAEKMQASNYGTNLERFIRLFPREQFAIHLYEEFRQDAAGMMRRIFAFLGVDPDHPIDFSRRHNEPFLPRSPRLDRLRRKLVGDRALAQLLPDFLKPLTRALYTRRREHVRLTPDDRRLIIDHRREEILRTQDLIGRDLSAWMAA